jgi:hypothetical protein
MNAINHVECPGYHISSSNCMRTITTLYYKSIALKCFIKTVLTIDLSPNRIQNLLFYGGGRQSAAVGHDRKVYFLEMTTVFIKGDYRYNFKHLETIARRI